MESTRDHDMEIEKQIVIVFFSPCFSHLKMSNFTSVGFERLGPGTGQVVSSEKYMYLT